MPQIEQEEEGPREEGGAFFITGTNEEQKRREGPQMQSQEPVQEVEEDEDQQQQPEEVNEDYGKLRMEQFKQHCRNLLGKSDSDSEDEEEEEPHINKENKNYQNLPAKNVENVDYEGTVDIVSAYKALKQTFIKSSTVHAPGTSVLNSKNYLRMTIAATQHSKSKMVSRDVLEYSLMNSKLILSLENRVSTSIGGSRPLPPQAQKLLNENDSRTGTAPQGQRRAPLWRRTRAEVVDEKVEKLFEAYKAIDAKHEELAK